MSRPALPCPPSRDEDARCLFLACERSDLYTLCTLLHAGVDLTQVNDDGCTALQYCAQLGWLEGFQALLPQSHLLVHAYSGESLLGSILTLDPAAARPFFNLMLQQCKHLDQDEVWARQFGGSISGGHPWALQCTLEALKDAGVLQRLPSWAPPARGWLGIALAAHKLRSFLPKHQPGISDRESDHVHCTRLLLQLASTDVKAPHWGWPLALQEAVEQRKWAFCEPLFLADLSLSPSLDAHRQTVWVSLSESAHTRMPLVKAFMERETLRDVLSSAGPVDRLSTHSSCDSIPPAAPLHGPERKITRRI